MISDVTEYLFVSGVDPDADHPHGDLDRIVINGGIMPLRAAADKSKLRGEDIAFMLEACQERSHALGGADTSTFTRKVIAAQPYSAALIIQSLYSGRMWTFANASWSPAEFAGAFDLRQIYPSNVVPVSARQSSVNSFYRGARVQRAPIEAIFADIARLDHFLVNLSSVTPTAWSTVDVPDIGTSGDPFNPSIPFSPDAGYYSYFMTRWGGRHWDIETQGSRTWTATNGDLSFSSDFARAAKAIVGFDVTYADEAEGSSVRYVAIAADMTQSGSTFTLSAASIAALVPTALSTLGISATPYPGRAQGDTLYCAIRVGMTGAAAVCELRDRTVWA